MTDQAPSFEAQKANVDQFTEGLLTNLTRKLEEQGVDKEQLALSIRAVGEAVKSTVGTVTPAYMAAALMSYGEALDFAFGLKMQEQQARTISEDIIDRVKTTH